MLRLTFRSLRANKVRFALTTFGVMLAVSFVVSAFVLGDGLRSSFGDVADETTAGIDLEVRPVADFGDPPPLPADLVEVVAAVPGVADAVPRIEAPWDAITVFDVTGEPIETVGPPQIAEAWSDNAELSAFDLVDGAAPGIGEFTVDVDSATEHDLVIGQGYDLTTPSGRVSLTLSGTSTFGADNATLGAVLVQLNGDQAAALLDIDGVNAIKVEADDGVDLVDLQAAIAAAVPTAEVVDQETVADDASQELIGDINVVGNVLLGFGGVALFVSIFIIYNTFAIVLGQRTRELALLRTVGADPAQLRRSVLLEALVVGVVASAVGIVAGIGVTFGLRELFSVIGADLPDSPIVLSGRSAPHTQNSSRTPKVTP